MSLELATLITIGFLSFVSIAVGYIAVRSAREEHPSLPSH